MNADKRDQEIAKIAGIAKIENLKSKTFETQRN